MDTNYNNQINVAAMLRNSLTIKLHWNVNMVILHLAYHGYQLSNTLVSGAYEHAILIFFDNDEIVNSCHSLPEGFLIEHLSEDRIALRSHKDRENELLGLSIELLEWVQQFHENAEQYQISLY